MANFLKSILDAVKLTDEEDFDDFDEYEEKEARQSKKRRTYEEQPEPRRETRERKPATSFATRQMETRRSFAVADENDEDEYAVTDLKKERTQRNYSSNNSVVPLRSRSTASSSTQHSSEICIMKPTRFEDSQDVCDMLLQGRAAVVNLEGLELTLSQRIMDFISGAVYSLNGKLHQVSGYIFIISPESFDISGDYLNFIEQSGFEVPNLK